MLFNSLAFALFLPLVFAAYWLCPDRWRWVVLLVSSYYFYMSWNAAYVVLILMTTAISYAAARGIAAPDATPRRKKLLLAGTLVVCLGTLFFFKYFNFFSGTVTELLQSFALPVHPVVLNLLLPVGISFYTFQTLSYVIDVYRGEVQAERHFGKYAVFVSFFPQLVAGPIERTGNLLPQVGSPKRFSCENAVYGVKWILWGYFKKIVVADTVAQYVDLAYNSPGEYRGGALLLASALFTIQIYCDFSGYSDIALGVARLFGVELMVNFKSPYFSRSVKEFWGRWHISLSTWFRDYVYIPLGGNRRGKLRTYRNLLITFLVSGLWHGANWTFVVWGGLHGAAQVLEKLLDRPLKALRRVWPGRALAWLVTFVFCNFAWIFFRADSIGEAAYVIQTILPALRHPRAMLADGLEQLGISTGVLLYLLCLVLALGVYDFLNRDRDLIKRTEKLPKAVQFLGYLLLALAVVWFCQKGKAAAFIYFQF